MTFHDHFSAHARLYASARPDYPEKLFAWLSSQCCEHELAWDCATGNGQAANGVARYFKSVIASDASESQLAAANRSDKLLLTAARAEQPPLVPGSVDLITVAQALHWFDIPAFFSATDVALKPAGVLAVWCYGLCRIEPQIDSLVDFCYHETLADYWPPERRLVEEEYATIRFPYTQLNSPQFSMEKSWTREQLLGYLYSWSATQRYIEDRQEDPVALLKEALYRIWPDQVTKTVSWSFTLRAARKPRIARPEI